MSYPGIVWAVALKDLRSEARSRHLTPAMLVFCLTVLIIFTFVFEPGSGSAGLLAPGILMAAVTFAGMLGLARFFAVEREQEAIRGLLLAPVDRSALYLGKVLSGFLFLAAVELVSLPAFGVFYNLDLLPRLPALLAVLLPATLGYVAVGVLYAALTSNLRLREVLLPVLLFPVIVPLLLAGVKGGAGALAGRPLSEAGPWLRLLLAYDGVSVAVGALTFEYVIGE